VSKKKVSYQVPAVSKVVKLVEFLGAQNQPLGVARIAAELGYNKMSVFRTLQTLRDCGWVIRNEDEPSYVLSRRPFHCVSRNLCETNLSVAAAGPLKELWQANGAYTCLCIPDGDRLLTIQALSPTFGDVKVSSRVGGRYLMHCSAPGKVLLAHGDSSILERLAKEGFERRTPHSICDLGKLKRNLAQVKARGYALDLEEYTESAMCLSAPVFDAGGAVVAAVNQTVLTLYYSRAQLEQDIGPLVLDASRRISMAMGYDADIVAARVEA